MEASRSDDIPAAANITPYTSSKVPHVVATLFRVIVTIEAHACMTLAGTEHEELTLTDRRSVKLRTEN